MRLLLFSDVHCDADAAERLVARSVDADVVICAGDLGVMRTGLQETVDILSAITAPTVLVAGNGESDAELAAACLGWSAAHVLHGTGCDLDGIRFWGLGGAVPVTPFGSWSFDLSEGGARTLLDSCPTGGVLVTHAPPLGHVDEVGGHHLGSRAILETIERAQPRLAVCGHIHACWTQESWERDTRIVNAGPGGVWVDL
ncbi:MAG: metallophosphoesterase family protein [Gemmatimonadetes bacterium]|nr:metallophosphoesterase family protein [Gemmatimonadota bacterium]MDA1103361.1 metallophosphoesterase family protein [Gemmatimonadota bacterium]